MSATLAELSVSSAQTVYASGGVYYAGELLAELPLAGGSVTADARRAMMRNASISIAADASDIATLYDALALPGAEVALERGFELPDGTRIGAALGRFVVDEITHAADVAGEALSVTLSDLSKRVSRARWTDTHAIAAGAALADALNGILADRAPSLGSRITASNTPGTLAAAATFDAGADSDPWADARAVAAAFGYTLTIDVDGYAAAIPEPILLPTASVFTFERGAAAIVTDRSRVAPLERTYNGVIVTGEGPELETPVRGEAWDSNPASATYYLGPFGRVPLFYSSPLITSTSQANAAASTRLAGVLGRVEQLTWAHVVHPGLKPLDVVLVESAAGALVPYVLDALTIPLAVDGAAGAVAREIQATY